MEIKEVSKESLRPIEIQNSHFSNVRKATSFFLISFAVASFSSAVGATLSFVNMGITLTIGVCAGGVIGLITGIVLAILLIKKERSPLQQYRIQTLEQIATDQPLLKEQADKIRQVFLQKEIVLDWGGDHHALHDHLMRITVSDEMKSREGLKAVWKKFLENSDGLEMTPPKGPKHRLDPSMELERLEGHEIPLSVERLNSKSATFEKDLEQLFKLREESEGEGWNIEENANDIGMRERFSRKNPTDGCILIRRDGTEEILGSLWYMFDEKNKVTIACLARSAKAARLHIGNLLLGEFFKTTNYHEVHLHVRSKNLPAIQLYKNHYFDVFPDPDPREKGYHFPEDKALYMRFNYQKYLAAYPTLQAI